MDTVDLLTFRLELVTSTSTWRGRVMLGATKVYDTGLKAKEHDAAITELEAKFAGRLKTMLG